MNVLIDISTEIELIRKQEQHGIEVVKGKEKLSMSNYKKGLYLDLSSFANALGVGLNKLLEDISYNPAIRGHLAYYRNENKVIRVVDIDCLSQLTRNLASSGYDVELLKATREQIYKAVEQLEREVSGNGKN